MDSAHTIYYNLGRMITQPLQEWGENGGNSDSSTSPIPSLEAKMFEVATILPPENDQESSPTFRLHRLDSSIVYASPSSYSGALADAYENAVNLGYTKKSRVISGDNQLTIDREHIAGWYVLTMDQPGFETSTAGHIANETLILDSKGRYSAVLGGLVIKEPIPTESYIEQYFVDPCGPLALLSGQIFLKYGNILPQGIDNNTSFIEFYRTINIAKERSILKSLPREVVGAILQHASTELLHNMKQQLFVDALTVSKAAIRSFRPSHSTQPNVGIIGAIGFPQGGPEALLALFARQASIVSETVSDTKTSEPLTGFFPDMRKPIQTHQLLSLSFDTRAQYKRLFNQEFYSIANGPQGAGVNPLIIAGALYVESDENIIA